MKVRIQTIERKRIIFDCDDNEQSRKVFFESLKGFRMCGSGPTFVLKNVKDGQCYAEGERVIKTRYGSE